MGRETQSRAISGAEVHPKNDSTQQPGLESIGLLGIRPIILSSDKAKQEGICGAKGAVIISSIAIVRWICSALPRLCHHFMFHWFMSQEDLACGKRRIGMRRLSGSCTFKCFAILIEDWAPKGEAHPEYDGQEI